MMRKSNASSPSSAIEQPASLLAPTPRVSSSYSPSAALEFAETLDARGSVNNPRVPQTPTNRPDSTSPSRPHSSSSLAPTEQSPTTSTTSNVSSTSSLTTSTTATATTITTSTTTNATTDEKSTAKSDPDKLDSSDNSLSASSSSRKLLRPAVDPQSEFYTAVAESSEFGTTSKAVEEGYLRHSVSAVHRVSIAADKHEAQQQHKLASGIMKKQESSKTMTKKDKPVKAPAPALVIKKAATLDLSTPMYVDRWGDVHNGERKEELTVSQQRKLVKKATSREAKWLAMAARWREVSTKNKTQLRRRIRKGIPDSLRPLVWPHLCCSAIEKSKPENRFLYQHLLSQEIAPADDEQIRKDLPRAFQTHVMFKSPEAGSRDVVCSGQASLYNILKAYSIRHRSIGYVQGMTGLAGLCLMYLPEEDAYWMLEVLLSGVGETEGLSRLYEKGMPLAFEYLAIYESLLRKRLPVLADHLQSLGVLPTSYAFRWLTTRFALFPKGLMIRIFDIFLHEGMKIIYRVCLYLMTRFAKDLLKLDYEGVSTLLESIKTHPSMYDEDEVIRGALKIKLKGKMLAEMSKVYRAGVENKEESTSSTTIPTPRSESRASKNS